MAAVDTPAFLTPTDAMMQIGSMFDHGNSVGAAFVLLSVGRDSTSASSPGRGARGADGGPRGG